MMSGVQYLPQVVKITGTTHLCTLALAAKGGSLIQIVEKKNFPYRHLLSVQVEKSILILHAPSILLFGTPCHVRMI